MSGTTRTTQHHYQYNVSKGATIHLNTLLAQELRRPGVKVRVNRCVGGIIFSLMLSRLIFRGSFSPGIFPSEMTGSRSYNFYVHHTVADGD
jgi:hypothetical protein